MGGISYPEPCRSVGTPAFGNRRASARWPGTLPEVGPTRHLEAGNPCRCRESEPRPDVGRPARTRRRLPTSRSWSTTPGGLRRSSSATSDCRARKSRPPAARFRGSRSARAQSRCSGTVTISWEAPRVSGVHHLAIATPDPAARAAECGFAASGATPGLGGGSQVELAARDTCGIATRLCEPIAANAGDGASDRVERIDHIGIASEDNRAAGAVFTDRLGCPVESTQTDFEVSQAIESFTSDKYGVVYHSRPPEPVGGLRVSFLTVGDCELELLQPFDPRRTGGWASRRPGARRTRQHPRRQGRHRPLHRAARPRPAPPRAEDARHRRRSRPSCRGRSSDDRSRGPAGLAPGADRLRSPGVPRRAAAALRGAR